MMIAHITSGKPLQGFVMSFEDLTVAVHCQYDGVKWEPLFGIKRGKGKAELPACFELADDAIGALDIAADEYMNGDSE